MRTLTLNERLALLAVGLGAAAVFSDVHLGRRLTVHEKEFVTRVERAEDHVGAAELAAWIIEGRNDYRLLDLRAPAAYADYHIPTAENLPLASLDEQELLPTEKVVLYSDGGIHASQAMMLLWARGRRNVYTLLGGLDAWKDEVLFPVAPASPTAADQAAFERSIHVARFFGGQPRAAAPAGASGELLVLAAPEMPKVAPPPPATGAATPRRKKKEGC